MQHTSKIAAYDTADYANTIIDAWQFGKSLEKIVSGDKPPEKDQENLKRLPQNFHKPENYFCKLDIMEASLLRCSLR